MMTPSSEAISAEEAQALYAGVDDGAAGVSPPAHLLGSGASREAQLYAIGYALGAGESGDFVHAAADVIRGNEVDAEWLPEEAQALHLVADLDASRQDDLDAFWSWISWYAFGWQDAVMRQGPMGPASDEPHVFYVAGYRRGMQSEPVTQSDFDDEPPNLEGVAYGVPQPPEPPGKSDSTDSGGSGGGLAVGLTLALLTAGAVVIALAKEGHDDE